MGSKHFTVALFCVVLYSLRSDAVRRGENKPPALWFDEAAAFPDFSTGFSSSSLPLDTSETQTAEVPIASSPDSTSYQPLVTGEDNLFGPHRRKKVIRRTRRRRIKKPKLTPEPEDPNLSSSFVSTETVKTAEDVSSTTPRDDNFTNTNDMKLEVVPIDSELSVTEEVSASLPSPSPAEKPRTRDPSNIFKPGYFTRHNKKRTQPKSTLWKVPNFSMELFDTDTTEEEANSNVDKRESTNLFDLKPTTLSNLTDMNTEESINPFVNTSSPISTELQNSLQFTLQVLHPLLNSDSVLTDSEPKIPENKTVAVTHSLSSTIAETPIAPDVRFLPTQLRKSHPLLSQDSYLDFTSVSKLGPRVNVQASGIHSMRNHATDNQPVRNRGRFSTTTGTSTTSRSTTRMTTSTTPSTTWRTTTSTERSTTTPHARRTSIIPIVKRVTVPTPAKSHSILDNVEPTGNLKITELVYPVGVHPEHFTTSTRIPDTTLKTTTTSTEATTSFYGNIDSQSPPIIMMGTDASASEIDESKGSIESPPAFDDLLLEELVKGFNPALIATEPQVTLPTTLPTTSTTTTTTTTTPAPTTTRTTTTTMTTTTTEAPKMSDEETNQLLQLLNILQQPQTAQTTEAVKTGTAALGGKIDDELLKNLALLDTLLSPTAKTMIKEAVETGTTEKIKAVKDPSSEGLSDADLKAIYMLLDTMGSSTPQPTTTTTPKPSMHPALQSMLSMLTNPWSEIKKQQTAQNQITQEVAKPAFTIPEPPKPVPTSSSLDLLSQLFNLNPPQQTDKPKVPSEMGLGALFGSLLPKRTPSREATSGSNHLFNFFQPEPQRPATTPPSGPYYWFDVNAFLGNDPNSGTMSGFRPKIGTRDYFLKVRRRRDSMERY